MVETAYADALPAQHRLHWYSLERVLGQGGFGITYLARDTNLDQAVAIKEYLPVDVATRRADASVRARTDDQGERYRWGLDRFIKEARTLARFDHPNIVRVLSVFEANNTAYMVMRFEEGENFGALLERRRTLPEAELMRVLLPIVDGLALVHGAGFIHRDIKPDNIHIRADGSPVLLDFGSARLALGQARTVTILVAPGYAPFEQYYSTGENQGPWTDIYGLGATCYRAISGIAPMDAIARSKGKLGSTQELLVPASAIGKGRYSERLLGAIDHALEFSERDRPQTLADWRREIVEEKPAAAAATVVSMSPPPGPAEAPTAPLPSAPAAPGSATVTRGVIVGSVIGAAIAVIAVVLYLQPGAERKELAQALQRSETDRRRLETQQQELERRDLEAKQKLEMIERQQREEQQRREAAARHAAEERAKPKAELPRAPAKPAAEPVRRRPEATPAAAAKSIEAARAAPAAETKPETPRPATPQVTESALSPAPSPPSTVAAPAEPRKPAAREPEKIATAAPAASTAAPPDERTRALQGDAAAQFRLGEAYESGRGVKQNYFQAYYWFAAAERSGYAGAGVKKELMAARLQPAEIQQADKLVERLPRLAK